MTTTNLSVLTACIIQLEQQLHHRPLSAQLISSLLADDFTEFGQSGCVYDKAQVMALLSTAPPTQIESSDFKLQILSTDAVLLRYRTQHTHKHKQTLRSSIWRNENAQWRMVFHQSTPIVE
ncbi:hypothetical protein DTO96_100336 [Ephemeroptericola cinctiostellae]|uniref:DUF4440 domain-containing protein n=1 Tax=Ephemeroptericola cinctiostellae TaxID=2268024 RepID=A0A345D8D8_9BURK|nr:DUF4440 domain-containing protein [Ephemeroptericola cinctiostellae]AXF84626.1 hypothetical protein DTO96_100336 [Ephemeroptericola cinctiostellae]